MTEELNRAAKAMKLLMALESEARDRDADPNTSDGAHALALLATDLTPGQWALFARKAGVNPPSEKTQLMVFTLFRAKAAALTGRIQPMLRAVR